MQRDLSSIISYLFIGLAVISTCLFLNSCGCGCKNAAKTSKKISKSDFSKDVTLVKGKSGKVYPIYQTKTGGDPVLLLHELPGLTPAALSLALDMEDWGYKVYTPKMFGRFGQNSNLIGMLDVGVSPQFNLAETHDTGVIRKDLMAFVDHIKTKHPNKKITVIGNCLTGGVPLELLSVGEVDTVVLCQPAVPLAMPWNSCKTKELFKESWGLPEESLDQAISELERNPHKRIIVFQYARDENSSYKKVERLTKKMRNAGIFHNDPRFQVYSGWIYGDKNSEKIIQKNKWNKLRIGNPDGHSTVTGAEEKCGDRAVFRNKLKEILK